MDRISFVRFLQGRGFDIIASTPEEYLILSARDVLAVIEK